MKHKKEQSTETTNYISPRVSMSEPNEEIPIYKGDFQLKDDENLITLAGSIWYSWLPDPLLRFSGTVIGPRLDFQAGTIKELVVNGHIVAQANLTGLSTTPRKQTLDGFCLQASLGDISKPVTEVQFVIPNIRYFRGETVQIILENKESIFGGGMTLQYLDYEIKLNLLSNHAALENELKAKGGYLILGSGVIRKKNATVLYQDSLGISKDLNIFLSFINGRRADISFLTGVSESLDIWKHYGFYQTDSYLPVINWTQIHDTIDYQSIFSAFMKLRENKTDKSFIEFAIHWYIEASQFRSYIEGAIIFIQTALELVYNWLLIEKKKLIIGDDADRISASNKIRLVLSQLNTVPKIPDQLSSLSSINGQTDGPDIFVKIRNALIHGQEKKRILLNEISPNAKTEAFKLGLWYLELSLLYVLNYNGNYYNRITRQSEIVPWFKP